MDVARAVRRVPGLGDRRTSDEPAVRRTSSTPIKRRRRTRVLDGLVTVLSRMTWLGVDRRRSPRSPASLAGWRMARRSPASASCVGAARAVGAEPRDARARCRSRSAIALLIGIPLGIWAGTASARRADPASGPGRDADDPGVRLPACRSCCCSASAPHGADRDGDLRAAAGDPAHEPRDPRRCRRDLARGRTAFGATSRQMLRKVQLPLAKPSIMLGRQPDAS